MFTEFKLFIALTKLFVMLPQQSCHPSPSEVAGGHRLLGSHTNEWLWRQASKPQLRRWIDTVGEVYAKFVIAATFAALVVLPMCGVPMLSANGQRGAFYRAMGLLTTASPCALVLVPLAYVSAIAAITSRCAPPHPSPLCEASSVLITT